MCKELWSIYFYWVKRCGQFICGVGHQIVGPYLFLDSGIFLIFWNVWIFAFFEGVEICNYVVYVFLLLLWVFAYNCLFLFYSYTFTRSRIFLLLLIQICSKKPARCQPDPQPTRRTKQIETVFLFKIIDDKQFVFFCCCSEWLNK